MGARMYRPTFSWPRYYLDVNGQLHALVPLTPGGTHCVGSWVDHRTFLDDIEKRKLLTLPGLELRLLGHPARSQSLYRLRYPNFLIFILKDPKIRRSLFSEKQYLKWDTSLFIRANSVFTDVAEVCIASIIRVCRIWQVNTNTGFLFTSYMYSKRLSVVSWGTELLF
jgi:hypothetical protein